LNKLVIKQENKVENSTSTNAQNSENARKSSIDNLDENLQAQGLGKDFQGDEENKEADPNTDKKPASPEFNSLKDIDGNIIKHEEVNQEEPEDPNQTVHFKVDSKEEVDDEPESPANIHLNQKPRKSILKKSLSSKSFGGDKQEPEATGIQEGGIVGPVGDSIEFLSVWKGIKNDISVMENFFTNQANPQDFSAIFSDGISPELLSDIISTVHELSHTDAALALKVLEHLPEIKDFEAVSKSLSNQQKIDIHTMFVTLRAKLNLEEGKIQPISDKYPPR